MSTLMSSAPSSCSGRQGLVLLFCLLTLCLLLLLPGAVPATAEDTAGGTGDELRILRITPAGEEVPVGRQIVIEFNRAVVPLGRMERTAAEIPVTIEPQLNCRWRWLNPSTLACNLDEQDTLLPATSYVLVVSPGIADGAAPARPVHHRFTTELPRVTDTWFSSWLAPQLPETMVRFNLPMDQASLSAHLFYLAPGGRRIPAVVAADPDEGASTGENDRQRLWRVHPQQELPVDTPVNLSVEPGIAALRGK